MTHCLVRNYFLGGGGCKEIILVAILEKVGSDRLKTDIDTKKIW